MIKFFTFKHDFSLESEIKLVNEYQSKPGRGIEVPPFVRYGPYTKTDVVTATAQKLLVQIK